MCDLCEVVRTAPERDRYGSFVLVPRCRTCGVPMLVYVHHTATLPPEVAQEFDLLVRERFLDRKPRGHGMRSIKGHWHEHLVSK